MNIAINRKPKGKGWKRYDGGWGKNIKFMQSATNPLIFVMIKADSSKPCEYRSDFMNWKVKPNFRAASKKRFPKI